MSTPRVLDHIRDIMITRFLEYGSVIMVRNTLDIPSEPLKSRECRGNNVFDQSTCCVEDVNPAYDRNVLNFSNSMNKIFIAFMFSFPWGITHHRNISHDLFLICRVIMEGCTKFSKFSTI